MPKYLFTSDQRISELPQKISWVANYVLSGKSISDITNKSENNNAATLAFYYNLYQDSDICKIAAKDPILAIRNYVLKFQFPNTRTSESFYDSLNEKTLLAPFRSVVRLLYYMANSAIEHSSYLSLSEILYFIFCDKRIFQNPIIDYQNLIIRIKDSRKIALDLDAKIATLITWNQYHRQSGEMMKALPYASDCFQFKNGNLVFSMKDTKLYERDSDFINQMITYDRFWYPTNSNNFNLARNEYISYMDTTTTPYMVYELNNQKTKNIDFENISVTTRYRIFQTSIKSKPFLLLAGISGTGKSRIVRELARACWEVGTSEHEAHKPKNFEMIQVKPNWHDSSELIGYLSNINGTRFIAGKFLEFVVKAWTEPETPYFLCLDEMNLAPVEQYFAEYLSVIESRKLENGRIVTDAILSPDKQYSNETVSVNYNKLEESWYLNLINELLAKTEASEDVKNSLREQFKKDGITIPQNLIVVGTVNMDETTFSFSRKVLDRAMTIEMNEVDLHGGLENKHEKIGPIGKNELIGNYVEGSDVYSSYKEVCDKALDYLKAINDKLEGTPFKVAYRTRNEFLLYVVNNLPYKKDEKGNDMPENFIIARALDEITNMKILSRIEGDETKVKGKFLDDLNSVISAKLAEISGDYIFVSKLDESIETDTTEDGRKMYASVSMAKLDEMKKRLESGYTSFWS